MLYPGKVEEPEIINDPCTFDGDLSLSFLVASLNHLDASFHIRFETVVDSVLIAPCSK